VAYLSFITQATRQTGTWDSCSVPCPTPSPSTREPAPHSDILQWQRLPPCLVSRMKKATRKKGAWQWRGGTNYQMPLCPLIQQQLPLATESQNVQGWKGPLWVT